MRRTFRLRKSADFQRVRANRQSWAHPLLVLYVAPNDGDVTRVGLSVGKRVGGAVVRNRVRRRIREAVRRRHPALPAGYDLVFVARQSSADTGWPELQGAVEHLLYRARLLERP